MLHYNFCKVTIFRVCLLIFIHLLSCNESNKSQVKITEGSDVYDPLLWPVYVYKGGDKPFSNGSGRLYRRGPDKFTFWSAHHLYETDDGGLARVFVPRNRENPPTNLDFENQLEKLAIDGDELADFVEIKEAFEYSKDMVIANNSNSSLHDVLWEETAHDLAVATLDANDFSPSLDLLENTSVIPNETITSGQLQAYIEEGAVITISGFSPAFESPGAMMQARKAVIAPDNINIVQHAGYSNIVIKGKHLTQPGDSGGQAVISFPNSTKEDILFGIVSKGTAPVDFDIEQMRYTHIQDVIWKYDTDAQDPITLGRFGMRRDGKIANVDELSALFRFDNTSYLVSDHFKFIDGKITYSKPSNNSIQIKKLIFGSSQATAIPQREFTKINQEVANAGESRLTTVSIQKTLAFSLCPFL